MKHVFRLSICSIFISIVPAIYAQSINVKAGLNYANISKVEVSQFNTTSKSGYFLGAGVTNKAGLIRFTSELLYSKQGYDYKNGTTSGGVDLQYLLLPQSISLNLGEFFSVHTGIQFGFITKLKLDSTTLSGNNVSLENLAKNISKGTLSVIAGAEASPVKGLFIGARYNHPLGNFLKKDADKGLVFAPDKNLKNNLIQIYLGLRFSLRKYMY